MCVHPIYVKNQAKGDNTRSQLSSVHSNFLVPCGKCVECQQKYQNSWVQRLLSEAMRHGEMYFVTLTYNPTCVPVIADSDYPDEAYMTFDKKHIVNWLKSYREDYLKRHGQRLKFKYFICSEYGPKHLRPHYHCLFFGFDKVEIDNLVSRWTYGYTDVKRVEPSKSGRFAVCRYVSKYCCKGIFENPLVAEGKVMKPFKLISKGLGEDYILENYARYIPKDATPSKQYSLRLVSFVASNLYYEVDGFRYTLCRYYKDKLFNKYHNEEKPNLSHPAKPFLRAQVANYKREQFEQNYRQRVANVAKNFHVKAEDSIAHHETLLQCDCEARERARDTYWKLRNFYERSQF